MKFYATKYWATKGIIAFEGGVGSEGEYVRELTSSSSWGTLFLKIGRDAFVNMCEAEADVEHKAHRNLHSKELALKKAKALLQKAIDRKVKVVKR
jgi:hypothetical protein